MSDEHVPAFVDVKASHVGMFKLRIGLLTLYGLLWAISLSTYVDPNMVASATEGPHRLGFAALFMIVSLAVLLAFSFVNLLLLFGTALVSVTNEGLILKYSLPALGRWANKEWRVTWGDIVRISAKTNKQGQVQTLWLSYSNRSNTTFSRCDALDDLFKLLKCKVSNDPGKCTVKERAECFGPILSGGPSLKVIFLVFLVLTILLFLI
ncbi:MAG: hypothetical protein WC655_25945 [Candidatus Hydrogenedentales bacterium]|jgi:hypothetical protein